MSVLACDKYGCKNIMCDHRLNTGEHSYYICPECIGHLTSYILSCGEDIENIDCLMFAIDLFMSIRKQKWAATRFDAIKELDKLIKAKGSPMMPL